LTEEKVYKCTWCDDEYHIKEVFFKKQLDNGTTIRICFSCVLSLAATAANYIQGNTNLRVAEEKTLEDSRQEKSGDNDE